MKKILSIGVLLLCISIGTQAQSGKEELEAAEQKAADKRERSLGGKRTANYLKDDQGKVQPVEGEIEDDTTASNDPAQDTESTRSQDEGESGQSEGSENSNGLMNANEENADEANNAIGDTTNEEKTSTPAVIQQTSSESGSPSVLSKEQGKARDGTGNVQRATPNMVGSPVPANWNLADENVNPSNSEVGTQVRQQEEQPSRTGPDREDTGARRKDDTTAEKETRVETDTDSKKETRKERRKSRKNRDKDS